MTSLEELDENRRLFEIQLSNLIAEFAEKVRINDVILSLEAAKFFLLMKSFERAEK